MKNPFEIGAVKEYVKIVQEHEKAQFESGTVHAVYSTFSVAKDAEWSTRLFVLDMKEDDEEGSQATEEEERERRGASAGEDGERGAEGAGGRGGPRSGS